MAKATQADEQKRTARALLEEARALLQGEAEWLEREHKAIADEIEALSARRTVVAKAIRQNAASVASLTALIDGAAKQPRAAQKAVKPKREAKVAPPVEREVSEGPPAQPKPLKPNPGGGPSLAQRILEFMKGRPNEWFTPAEVARALDLASSAPYAPLTVLADGKRIQRREVGKIRAFAVITRKARSDEASARATGEHGGDDNQKVAVDVMEVGKRYTVDGEVEAVRATFPLADLEKKDVQSALNRCVMDGVLAIDASEHRALYYRRK